MAEMQDEEEQKRLAAEVLLRAAQDMETPAGGVSWDVAQKMVPKEELSIENVPPMERPLGSSSLDRRSTQVNELGTPTYDTPFGTTYSVEMNPDQRTLRQQVTDAVPPVSEWRMPSGEEIIDISGEVAKGAYEGVKDVVTAPARAARGETLSYGDVYNLAASMPAAGAAMAGKGVLNYDPNTTRMFIGPKAKNANLEKLSEAMEMDELGLDAKDIFEHTMWLQGPDGHWRQEVSDESFEFNNEMRQDLQDYDFVEKSIKGGLTTRPNSFSRNYPDKNINVAVSAPRGGLKGSYRPYYKGQDPEINLYGDNAKALEDTFLHELQHGVQDIEGWDEGSSDQIVAGMKDRFFQQLPQTHRNYLNSFVESDKLLEKIDNLDKTILQTKENLSGLKNPASRGYIEKNIERLQDEGELLERSYLDLQNGISAFEKDFPDSADSLKPVLSFSTESPYSTYHYNAGEIEARTTQERRFMSLAERRENFPDLTLKAFPRVWTQDGMNKNFQNAVRTALEETGKTTDDPLAHMYE